MYAISAQYMLQLTTSQIAFAERPVEIPDPQSFNTMMPRVVYYNYLVVEGNFCLAVVSLVFDRLRK